MAAIKKKMVLVLLWIVLIALAVIMVFDTRLKVVEYEIDSDKIEQEVRIALITDLHSCYYGENQSELFDELDLYEPDMLLLGGDIFDDVMPDGNAQILVREAAKRYDTYYVSGNHEWWSGRMKDIFEYIQGSGVTVLRGEVIHPDGMTQSITLCGIDDPSATDVAHLDWDEQLEAAAKNISKDSFNILLSHRPENAQLYADYGFDLALAGHAHGGQWRIPFVMNGFYAPNQGFFPKLAGGVYDFDGKKLVVSRGLADENTWLPRIFNRPELVFVTLK